MSEVLQTYRVEYSKALDQMEGLQHALDDMTQQRDKLQIHLAEQEDFSKAVKMFWAFNQSSGEPSAQKRDEVLVAFSPSRRAETWFLKMLDLGRGFLNDEELAFVLDDRFGETIIAERQDEYDALEIHGVRDHNLPGDPEGSFCEVNDQNPQFYSVYAHLKMGGCECVGDFDTPSLALSYAKELAEKYGWPINDFVSNKTE